MKIFQINNLDKQITKFYDKDMNEIKNKNIIDQFQKVALGFPKAILFSPPLKKKFMQLLRIVQEENSIFIQKNIKRK